MTKCQRISMLTRSALCGHIMSSLSRANTAHRDQSELDTSSACDTIQPRICMLISRTHSAWLCHFSGHSVVSLYVSLPRPDTHNNRKYLAAPALSCVQPITPSIHSTTHPARSSLPPISLSKHIKLLGSVLICHRKCFS